MSLSLPHIFDPGDAAQPPRPSHETTVSDIVSAYLEAKAAQVDANLIQQGALSQALSIALALGDSLQILFISILLRGTIRCFTPFLPMGVLV